MENIFFLNLNLVPYEQAWDLQKKLVALIKEADSPDFLILLEHPPVFTLGRWGKPEHLLVSRELLKEKEVSLIRCERGGNITFHGPGQLVGYPILKLKNFSRGVKDYVGSLEEVLVRTLSDWKVSASRKTGFPGVWVDGQKIASIGIAVRKGIAFHGFALNYACNRSYFDWINPCGLEGVRMTSLEEITGEPVSPQVLRQRVAFHFEDIFKSRLIPGMEGPGILPIL